MQDILSESKERIALKGNPNCLLEISGMREVAIRTLNIFEMKCLGEIAGVARMDRINIDDVLIRTWIVTVFTYSDMLWTHADVN